MRRVSLVLALVLSACGVADPPVDPLSGPEGPSGKTDEISTSVLGVGLYSQDASPEAAARAADQIRLVLQLNGRAQDRLKKAKLTIVIVPHDVRLTDLPQFRAHRGEKTFDGRLWDDVRGMGPTPIRGGWAIAVPEENLVPGLGAGPVPGAIPYPVSYSILVHELAHAVKWLALTKDQNATLKRLYDERLWVGPFSDAYARSNVDEYFAQGTNCYLGWNMGQGENGADWLQRNDPPMHELLRTIYSVPSVGGDSDASLSSAAPASPSLCIR